MSRARASGTRPSRLAGIATRSAIVLAGLVFATGARAECNREMLQQLADTYVAAQAAGDPAMLPLAERSYYGENDRPVAIAEGVLSQALTVDFTRSLLDTTLCATFTELVAATHAHPYVIHTRMEANAEGKLTVIESVVTDEDDWVFGAEPFLGYTTQEDWSEIPEDQRNVRPALQAAADAYINNWGDPFL
ncbi:MAG TPA: hypothetical protein VLA37_11390, partial [Sphingomonadaceae bacterium]|nr:hypothetical protein [Sphingomonadaceae bacterium]